MKKRLLAVLLCVIMVMVLLPTAAFAASTITFTTEPEANTFVTVGKITGSLTAQANVSDSGTATLNWYACSESGVITGDSLRTGESFTIPTDLAVDVYFYRCQATCEGAEPVNSRVAAVLVAPDVTFTTQPAENTTVTAGSITGNLTVETSVNPADTTGVTLNWYRASSGGEFIYGESLGTGNTFAIPDMLMPGTYYYLCQATIGTSLTVNSSVATVTVEEATGTTATIQFNEQPYSGTTYVTEGIISEVLTASASVSPSGTPTLNWYECTGLSGVVTGAPSLGTGETFAIPTDLQDVGTDYYYVCQATYPGAAPVNSQVSTIRVGKASESSPVIGFIAHPAPSTTVMEGSISGSLTVEAKIVPSSSGLTPTLQWYECGEDGFVSGPLLSTSETFAIPTGLTRGTYYYKCLASCEETSPTGVWSRVATVTVLDSNAGTVSTPTFSISGGTYTSAQSVTLSCDTQGATIRYTTNGTEPTQSSPAYSTAISVPSTMTIKAKAFKDGMLASGTASADYMITGNATGVWIWGKEFTSTNPYYHNGANGGQGTVDNNETGYNAYFNAATGTLTLKGLSVQNSTATKVIPAGISNTTFNYAIFAEDDLTINVIETSAVSTVAATSGNANTALCIKGDVTFTGTATLNATSGTGVSTSGVYILGDLEVSSGSLSGTAGDAGSATATEAESFGVSAMGTLTVSGGTLTGTGNTATATGNCISAGIGAGDVIVVDGTVSSQSGTATGDYALSYGLNALSLDIQGGDTQATGNTATGGSGGSFSGGIAVRGDLSVSGGSFTAEGGNATATGEARSQSYGIYAEADSIDFSGGTVEATGGEAGYESCGIKNAGNRNNYGGYIDGGAIAVSGTADVTANDGAAQFCDGLAAFDDITVTGGTITGIANGTASAGNRGVSVTNGNVTVSGGSMTGTAAGGGNFSYGLFVEGGSVTVSGGSMTATAAAAIHFSHGVRVVSDNGNISVLSGTLTAKSGSATNASALNKALTLGTGITAKGSTSNDGSNPVNYEGANNGSYMWVSIQPVVTSVAVNPAFVSIQKGGTQRFNATVFGANSPAQTVTWTVTGGVAGTSIDADGVLTVAANETAATLTVKATSTVNTAKFGIGTVTITNPPPTVTSVSVSPSTASVVKGDSKSFTATVTGENSPAQTVTWTVEGGATGTSISTSGVLTIAANETATTLTVKATSTVDTTKSGTATVTVTAPAPTVTSVSVSPATVSIQKGDSQTFTATVTGENSPAQTVTWTVEGGATGTSISTSGVLTVAANETAAMLTVKATSTVNTDKSGTATVTVTTPADPDPIKHKIIKGQDGKWTKGSTGGLGFTADGDYGTFTGVSVDGTALSSDKYTSQSGSTIVTLKASYLKTLSAGRHTLRINFTDGYAETNFTINAATDPDNPATGDSSLTWLWLGIALLAGAGLAASLVLARRKRQNG